MMLVPLRAWRSSFCTTSLCVCGQCQERLQPPAVDDVADQEDRLGLVVAQEIDQEVGLRRPRSEMDVRDEKGPKLLCGHAVRHGRPTVAFAPPMRRFYTTAV